MSSYTGKACCTCFYNVMHLRPVFPNKKIADDIIMTEANKSAMCCLWMQIWSVWCGLRWLHPPTPFQRIDEHKHSAIDKHVCVLPTILGTKIFRNNLPSLRNVVENLNA